MPETTSNIIDIELPATRKKKFRFDHDDNRVVYINTSDMTILSRIEELYPRLQELQTKAANITDGISLKDDDTSIQGDLSIVSARLQEVDKEMRELVDSIFNAPVCAAAAPDGSMYDPFEGQFRFEHILTALLNQYNATVSAEFDKMVKNMSKHTDKYTRGK